jgi:DNA-binding cell septation regulator SpoVG
MSAIEVLAIRRLDGTTTVKAFVDLRLGGVTLKGCKIVQQDGQKAWLAMPSVKTERAWQNVVELSKELRQRATDAVLAAWEAQQP